MNDVQLFDNLKQVIPAGADMDAITSRFIEHPEFFLARLSGFISVGFRIDDAVIADLLSQAKPVLLRNHVYKASYFGYEPHPIVEEYLRQSGATL